jgi:hypothetical protein
VLVASLAACSSETPTGDPHASLNPASASVAPASPVPTPTPAPTPEPTPIFTNPPNPSLEALIPDAAGGVTLVKPPSSEYAITPGDIGLKFGELGLRFTSLAIAYVEPRRLSLYAMEVQGDPVRTRDLRPYLGAAGRYVGGLRDTPWQLKPIGDHLVWVRGEDAATAAGTHIYAWAAEHYVFLMIGTDEAIDHAVLAALPGETPPPTPSPSATPRGSATPRASATAS